METTENRSKFRFANKNKFVFDNIAIVYHDRVTKADIFLPVQFWSLDALIEKSRKNVKNVHDGVPVET